MNTGPKTHGIISSDRKTKDCLVFTWCSLSWCWELSSAAQAWSSHQSCHYPSHIWPCHRHTGPSLHLSGHIVWKRVKPWDINKDQFLKYKNIKLNFRLLLLMHARIFISIVLVQFNITFVKTQNFELSYFQMKLIRASQRREKQILCRLVRFFCKVQDSE